MLTQDYFIDINECVALDKPCGQNAICENAIPGYNCVCPQGYVARPDAQVACEQVFFFCEVFYFFIK